jgi:hypothetical protein
MTGQIMNGEIKPGEIKPGKNRARRRSEGSLVPLCAGRKSS